MFGESIFLLAHEVQVPIYHDSDTIDCWFQVVRNDKIKKLAAIVSLADSGTQFE